MHTNTPDQTILQGDCIDEMQAMDENSVHAVVTDPPYGMAFMPGVNDWDEFDSPRDYQEWCEEWASECLRVLKPGGHLIAFSGSRTYGRLQCGVQDAGLEVRDTITWHYGQGFGAGKTQDVTNWMDDEDAEQWEGFKMGLKPATEFAVLARKPLDGPTYKNVLAHGTGALNVDETRIPTDESLDGGANKSEINRSELPGDERGAAGQGMFASEKHTPIESDHDGRYPANLCLDPAAAAVLDEQSGFSSSTRRDRGSDWVSEGSHRGYKRPCHQEYDNGVRGFEDSGGASRFFYTSKASPNERSINGEVENDHSTVKPLDLMEWLVTLITAPGQRVLDPFAGSGTTIMACRRLGREGLGIEKDDDHAELARKRVELAHELETDFTESGSFPEKYREAPSFNEWLENRDEDDADDTDGPTTLESFGDDD